MRLFRFIILFFPILLLVPSASVSEASSTHQTGSRVGTTPVDPPFLLQSDTRWADSVLKSLTPDERIAQLFMVAAYSNKPAAHEKEIASLVSKYHIGGLIFMQGGPVRQAQLTNRYQKLAQTPLMIAMDAEWGLSMRIDSTVQFPRQMTLGAIQNDALIYAMGRDMARQCKRLGVQISFSPDADVNNNAANPVIGTRSFGENKSNVMRKAVQYMKGLQDEGVLACGKHFPGHGDTDSDSHKTLPVIPHNLARLDSLELFPFKGLIAEGIGSMMVAHLFVPAYDTTTNSATTLSKAVVTGILKEQLGFKGLIFTDALNMKGVSQFYKAGEVDVKALLAGNDVLLFSGDVPKALSAIKAAIARGEISQEEIDIRCRKILLTKQWCGLSNKPIVKLQDLIEDLNTPESDWLNYQLAEGAVTILRNVDNLLPIQRPDTLRMASVTIGKSAPGLFHQRLACYSPVDAFSLPENPKVGFVDTLISQLGKFNLVFLSIPAGQRPQNNFALHQDANQLIESILKKGISVVADVFGSAYAIQNLPALQNCNAVLVSYEGLPQLQDVSAQIIFGGVAASGKLPVSVAGWKAGDGLATPKPIRLNYTYPEAVGCSHAALRTIDSIMKDAIAEKAFPGGQLFAAKDGKVFLMKSYGYFTYDTKHKVYNDDLYDIASVTKIMATTPLVMRYVEQKKLDLNEHLSTYLSDLTGSNKENIILRDMLAHQAGLEAWIPFWMKTVDKNGIRKKSIYRTAYSDSFPIYVAPGIFMRYSYLDSMYRQVITSPVSNVGTYKYSDLCFYFLKRIIEKNEQQLLTDIVAQNFYRPLGLPYMNYQPALRLPAWRCAPTENDMKFRTQQLQGSVHDQCAAMQGGIGGHAGVFSTANDVGVMMQLYLNGGTYGGIRYFDTTTVNLFTRYQFNGNRRGLGFDKPEPDPKKSSPVCDGISSRSFGHQGFTGTLAWADPETGIVFVFLSNRVYPDADENKLAKMGTRNQILKIILNEFQH